MGPAEDEITRRAAAAETEEPGLSAGELPAEPAPAAEELPAEAVPEAEEAPVIPAEGPELLHAEPSVPETEEVPVVSPDGPETAKEARAQRKKPAPARRADVPRPARRRRLSAGAVVAAVLKTAVLAVIVVLLLTRLFGANRGSSTSFEAMKAAVTGSARLDMMQEADNQMIRRLYGLDPKEYEGIVLFYPGTNMGADELLLVKLADADQMEAVSAAIDARLATQLNTFEGYGAEQTEMLKKSVKEVRAGYALFCSTPDPAAVQRAFEKAY